MNLEEVSMRHRFLAIAVFVSVLCVPSWAATYKVDAGHSAVTFKIKHLLSNVQGQFKEYSGTLDYEPGKPELWKAEGTIKTISIDTNEPKRDKHLQGEEFFDVEKYPTIDFKTTKVLEATETGAKLEGLISIHGVEKPIVLDVEIHGVGKDPWGTLRAGFTATTKINRKDFGIVWNKALETGGFLVGDDVTITLEIEAVQQ